MKEEDYLDGLKKKNEIEETVRKKICVDVDMFLPISMKLYVSYDPEFPDDYDIEDVRNNHIYGKNIDDFWEHYDLNSHLPEDISNAIEKDRKSNERYQRKY